MPDLEALNAVAAASIEAVNGVAKASVEAVNGVSVVSGQTATRWVAAFDGSGSNWYISYAAHSDRTSWTGTTVQSTTPHAYWLAYGKDGSGNAIWAAACDSNSMHVAHDANNDVTDGSTWTKVDFDNNKVRRIAWGNDVWIAIGHRNNGNELYRSTDGASWAEIDLSGLANINTTTIFSLASDGAGNWMFGQGNRIYASVNDGSAWAQMDSYEAGSGGTVCDIGFTNNTWVVLDAGTPGQINTVGAAAFATEMGGGTDATWGAQECEDGDGDTINTGTSGGTRTTMACGNGVAVIAHPTNTMAFDVNGTTIGVRASGKVAVGNDDDRADGRVAGNTYS